MAVSAPNAVAPRTERQILADALLALLRARPVVLAWDQCNPAMAVLGLNAADLSEARARVGFPVHATPPGGTPDVTDVPAPAAPTDDHRPVVSVDGPPPPVRVGEAAYRQTEPHPPTRTRPATTARPTRAGELRCSRCREWKAMEAFRLRTDRIGSGTRRSACDECFSRDNRSRYVNLTARAELNAIGITLSIEEGDEVARLRCRKCGQALGTDDVEAEPTEFAHVICPPLLAS